MPKPNPPRIPKELERFRDNPAAVAHFNRHLPQTPDGWDATFAHRLAKHILGNGARPRLLYVGDREWAWFQANHEACGHAVRHDPDGHKGAHGEYRGVRIIRCNLKKHWHFTA